MKTLILCLILMPLLGLAKSNRVTSSETELRTDYKPRSVYGNNFVGLELLGRGVLYSLNYDRALDSRLSLGVGFSAYQFNLLGINFTTALVPFYANYYLGGPVHRAFFTGGLNLLYVQAEIFDAYYLDPHSARNEYDATENFAEARGTTIHPSAGVGYEYRARAGFTFRGTAYINYMNDRLLRWYGATLGTHF